MYRESESEGEKRHPSISHSSGILDVFHPECRLNGTLDSSIYRGERATSIQEAGSDRSP
jgi:hypothetical protein